MNILRLLPYAFTGWILCGAIVVIGREATTIENALIMHLIGAPVIFSLLTKIYYERSGKLLCLYLAVFMLSFVIMMDFFVVSLIIEKIFDMFKSIIGTWLPFIFIFIAVFLTGKSEERKIMARHCFKCMPAVF